LLEPVSTDWGKRQLGNWGVADDSWVIGVNLMNEKPVLDRHPEFLNTVAAFLDILVERHNAVVLFLANDIHKCDGFDQSAARCTLGAMRHRERGVLAPAQYWTPQQMMSIIGNCHATISMRYHFCLFSALQSIPFIALKRSDKVRDLCWDLRWRYAAELNGLCVAGLADLFDALDAQRASAVAQVAAAIPGLRQRASANEAALDAIVTPE
jgi:polysaccharide pyruvyl transferase WcaK-like protein